MNKAKTAKLERAGWKLGTPKELLGLTEEEAALIDEAHVLFVCLPAQLRVQPRRHRLIVY